MFVWLEQVQEGAAAPHGLSWFWGCPVTCLERRGGGFVLFPATVPGSQGSLAAVVCPRVMLSVVAIGTISLPPPRFNPRQGLGRCSLSFPAPRLAGGCRARLCSPTHPRGSGSPQHEVGVIEKAHFSWGCQHCVQCQTVTEALLRGRAGQPLALQECGRRAGGAVPTLPRGGHRKGEGVFRCFAALWCWGRLRERGGLPESQRPTAGFHVFR